MAPKKQAKTNQTNKEDGRNNSQSKIVMILSPAKTLNLSQIYHIPAGISTTTPDFCHQAPKTLQIVKAVKQVAKSKTKLAKLLGISASLAATAADYWNNFDEGQASTNDKQLDNVKPSLFCFSGPAYQGLDAASRSSPELQYLQDHLRIVDPLYGILRPLDAMQPYRLEMATKGLQLDEGSCPKLAEFWKDAVTNRLLEDLPSNDNPNNDRVLLNLASDEYSAAVDASAFEAKGAKFVKVVFRQEGRVISVHAKRARGLMARFLAQTQATTLAQVEDFDLEGYQLDESESEELVKVFDRPKNWDTKDDNNKAKATSKKRKSTTNAKTTKATKKKSS